MASFCPRPLGRSGWVNTATTWWPASTVRSRLGTANAGVPMNTNFIWPLDAGRWPLVSFPLAGFLQLANLAPDQVALQGADVADVQLAVEVIGLMQKGARQEVVTSHLELFAFGVLGDHDDFERAHHLFAERRQAQAALFAFLRAFGLHDLRVD